MHTKQNYLFFIFDILLLFSICSFLFSPLFSLFLHNKTQEQYDNYVLPPILAGKIMPYYRNNRKRYIELD